MRLEYIKKIGRSKIKFSTSAEGEKIARSKNKVERICRRRKLN